MLFNEELRAALDQIRTAPQLGSAYQVVAGQEHGRLLMPRTRYHVYYRVVGRDRVRVVAVWSAVRGRGPRL
jgi:plasmid stabilization system protein ParE